MTIKQQQEVERIAGKNFDAFDIPPDWRGGKSVEQINVEMEAEKDENRMDQMEEMDFYDGLISEDELTDMFGEGGKEEVKEFYGSR